MSMHISRNNIRARMNIRGKKSQMEAFGLAIIVVLIIIGFFIIVSFRKNNAPVNQLGNYLPDEMASNFVNSIVNVNVQECNGYSLSDIARLCKEHHNVGDVCSESDACILFNNTVTTLLNKSLVRQNYPFRFYTQGLDWPKGTDIMIVNRGCNTNMDRIHSDVPIVQAKTYQTIIINLDICR